MLILKPGDPVKMANSPGKGTTYP